MSRLKRLCQLPHQRTRRLTPASRVPTAARRTRIRISRESIRSDSVTPTGLGKCKRLSEIRKAFFDWSDDWVQTSDLTFPRFTTSRCESSSGLQCSRLQARCSGNVEPLSDMNDSPEL